MTRRDDSVRSIHLLELVAPRTLDLVCKYLYFQHLLSSADSNEQDRSAAAQLYQKHIAHRTTTEKPATDPG